MRILVVEDEKKVASFIKRGLEEENYEVDIAYDGEEGLFMGETNPYDLIIMDVMLPKMDGVITSYSIHYTKLYEPLSFRLRQPECASCSPLAPQGNA